MADDTEPARTLPDTGSLEGDLSAYLHQMREYLESPSGAALVRSLAASATLISHRDTALVERRAAFSQLMERAVTRGDAAHQEDWTVTMDLLVSPLQIRVVTGVPIEPQLIDQLVTIIVQGIGLEKKPLSST